MRAKNVLRYGIIIVLIASLFGAIRGYAAPLYQDPVWTITSPTEGSTVSGQVAIQGTATHPNFESYGLLYARGPRPTADSQWVPIAFGVNTMVVNGTLATWDTTNLPNGQYTLALALYEVGSADPNLHFTNNITVFNEDATPTPEPTATPEEPELPPDEPVPPPDVDPIAPAPTVEQPPTATPRPTATPDPDRVVDPGDADDASNITDIFSVAAIQEALMTGIWLAVAIYVIGGLYQAGKIALRYYIRQQRRRRQSS